jgi:hypothetical protein
MRMRAALHPGNGGQGRPPLRAQAKQFRTRGTSDWGDAEGVIPGRECNERTMVRNCAPENLEIAGLVLTHHPGMTTATRLPSAPRPETPSPARSARRNPAGSPPV